MAQSRGFDRGAGGWIACGSAPRPGQLFAADRLQPWRRAGLHGADAPRNPKWAVTVRYKSNASLMRGMGGANGAYDGDRDDGDRDGQDQPPPPPKKRKGLGNILGGAIPHP